MSRGAAKESSAAAGLNLPSDTVHHGLQPWLHSAAATRL